MEIFLQLIQLNILYKKILKTIYIKNYQFRKYFKENLPHKK